MSAGYLLDGEQLTTCEAHFSPKKASHATLDSVRSNYYLFSDLEIILPRENDSLCHSRKGYIAFYPHMFYDGIWFPISKLFWYYLDLLGIPPAQMRPNGWRVMVSTYVRAILSGTPLTPGNLHYLVGFRWNPIAPASFVLPRVLATLMMTTEVGRGIGFMRLSTLSTSIYGVRK